MATKEEKEFSNLLAQKILEIGIKQGDISMENLLKIYFNLVFITTKRFIKEKYSSETGIWKTIQELIVTHNQPIIAKQICQTNNIDKQKARLLQLASDRWHEEMKNFIENSLI